MKEEGKKMPSITILRHTGESGIGNDVDIIYDHDKNQAIPVTADFVLFEDKNVGYIIAIDRTDPTAHIITVRPVDQGKDNIVDSTIDGQKVFIHHNPS